MKRAYENGAFKKGSQGLESQVADVAALRLAPRPVPCPRPPPPPVRVDPPLPFVVEFRRGPPPPDLFEELLPRPRLSRLPPLPLPKLPFLPREDPEPPCTAPPDAVAFLVRLLPAPFVRSDGSEGVRLGD